MITCSTVQRRKAIPVNKKQKRMLMRILLSAAMMIALHFLYHALSDRVQEPVWFLLYLIPYLTVPIATSSGSIFTSSPSCSMFA